MSNQLVLYYRLSTYSNIKSMNSSIKKKIVFLVSFLVFSLNLYSVDSARVYDETYFSGPSEIDSLNSIFKLVKDIDDQLNINSKNLKSTKYSLGVYSITHNRWYYSKDIDKPLTPASTTKLFTTYTLINLLGIDYSIPTEVYYDGSINDNGTLNGNLYIRGKGDPLFSTSDLELLADKVRKSGILKINGKIIADPTYFDEKTERSVYSGDNEVVQHTPPITSLNIDRNTSTIIVTAGSQNGVKPNIHVMPNSDSHIIINNAKVGTPAIPKRKPQTRRKKRSRGENNIQHYDNFIKPSEDLPMGDFNSLMLLNSFAGIKVGTNLTSDGKQQFIVNGTLKPNSTYSYQHLLYNPPLSIAGAFKNRLKAGGINVTGDISVKGWDSVSNKTELKFLTDFRRPVFDVINIVNKDSDNYLAEILFKIIGASAGEQNDVASQTRRITDSIIKNHGINFSGCVLNDGSGLSRRNLVTSKSLIQILEKTYHSVGKNKYWNSLSLASVDGTLKKRMKDTPAERNLAAKTGTLRNVSALAGYVTTIGGEELAFAFIFNGPNVGAYKLLENELGRILSSYQVVDSNPEVK